MTRPAWAHELRRVGWIGLLAPPAAIVLGIVFTVLSLAMGMTAHLDGIQRGTLGFLELGAGLAAASLTGADAAVELQLSLPVRYRSTVARRLTLALAWSALVSAALGAYLTATARDLGLGLWNDELMWLAPAVLLIGLGSAGRAATGSLGAAAGAVGIVWIFFQTLPNSVADIPWVRIWLLNYPVDVAHPQAYYANRALLVAVGLVLVGLAFWRLRRPERLMGDETS
jgi:hypothetical protein